MPKQGEASYIVADAIATAPNGEEIGLFIWALGDRLSGLELYSYSDNPAPLPLVSSISGHGRDAA
jgi:hypothetical protein